tara:strand:- start:1493 stop:1777 length:285 start_codon:yes stop_codon:yes gene_type:complete
VELGTATESVGQEFLFTAPSPTLRLGVNTRYTITYDVEEQGGTLTVWIDEVAVLQYINDRQKKKLFTNSGSIGLYTEDASVHVPACCLIPLTSG